jgi:hypothetical protein
MPFIHSIPVLFSAAQFLSSLTNKRCLFIHSIHVFVLCGFKYEKDEAEGPAEPVVVSKEAEELASLHAIARVMARIHYPEGAHFTSEEQQTFDAMRASARRALKGEAIASATSAEPS